ncbi:MAG: hypothetical protein ACYCWW_11400, partial [Deltaproteobacteria bacterium]
SDGGAQDAGSTVDAGVRDAGLPADAGPGAGQDAGCAIDGGALGPCSGSGCPWAAANPGDVVSLDGLDVTSLPELPLSAAAAPDAGTLVFSDDPETFPSSGLLYADTVGPGAVRLFVYHVNGTSIAKKLSVVLENDDPSNPVTVTVISRALSGPSTNYLYAGKVAVERWLAQTPGATVSVPAGAAALLDPTLDATSMGPGDLVNFIADLELSAPLRVVVVALDATTDTLSAYAGLQTLPRGSHQRGTFSPSQVLATLPCPLDTADGAFRVALGTAGPASVAILGTDATTGQSETLSGQYGVLDALSFRVTSSDGRELALLLSPRGGDYGGAALLSGPGQPAGVLGLPAAMPSLGDPTLAIALALLTPGGQSPLSFGLTWSLPGGSSGPVDLVVVPY